MEGVFAGETSSFRDLDYVAAWYAKATFYNEVAKADFAFVATKTICQGIQVAMIWPIVFKRGLRIAFAHRPFTWNNLAKSNAGVTCVIVGLSSTAELKPLLFEADSVKAARNIGPYLLDMDTVIVQRRSSSISNLPEMGNGNKPSDGGWLILSAEEASALRAANPQASRFLKRYTGSYEFVNGTSRDCIWVEDHDLPLALSIPEIASRIEHVRRVRSDSKGKQSSDAVNRPHRFVYVPHQPGNALIVPGITSENRPFLPVGFANDEIIISNKAMAAYQSPVWLLSIIASKLHWVWIGTVCVRMRTDFSYSNTLGYNTFPVPTLTRQDKADLTRCAEDILLAREAHFPATIADMYDPDRMDRDFPDLRHAHDRNDETLERIYIGRRFRNDTERLEHLFSLYTKMTDSDAGMTKKIASKSSRKMRAPDKAA